MTLMAVSLVTFRKRTVLSALSGPVAGRLAFPALLPGLTCYQADLRGFPCRRIVPVVSWVVHSLLAFTSPSKPHLQADFPKKVSSRGIHPSPPLRCSLVCVHSQEQAPFGADRLKPASWSALVVLHHLDGLPRKPAREFIAPRYQPWGSPRCRSPAPRTNKSAPAA